METDTGLINQIDAVDEKMFNSISQHGSADEQPQVDYIDVKGNLNENPVMNIIKKTGGYIREQMGRMDDME